MTAWIARARSAAWLGWQIESNWADPFLFIIYSITRPIATALILAGMYWAVAGVAARADAFHAFYVGNAFHTFVTAVVIGMGWVIVEEREDYETLKYVYTSPIGMFTYLSGRAAVKMTLAAVSVLIVLVLGWFVVGVRWNWSQVAWGPLALALPIGLVASLSLGLLVAGAGLVLPRVAITLNEGLAVALYLLCGVIFPVDLLPRGLQELALALPFTHWYEAMRRFLLGAGASVRLGGWSDGTLLAMLFATTLAFAILSRWGYLRLEHRARQLGRLDQTTMF